ALPGGFIFVNKGLMSVLNDDELAYVLGHEVGHVAARHIAKKLQSNMAYQLLIQIAFAGSDGNAAAIASGIDTVYNLIDLGYSRHDEYEADRLGVKYAFRAGFKPEAALSSLEKIKKEEGPNWKVLEYFRSHPYAEERIAALKKIIPQLTAQGENSPDWPGGNN
ncbi:MAG: M48 family metallopeptidase, partial [Candidatus Omnitrophota bacterium]